MTDSDGTKAKIKVPIPAGDYAYSVKSDFQQIMASLTGLKVIVSMQNGSGKFYVDDVSLQRTSAALSPLPLP
jgi:hypothetical protein